MAVGHPASTIPALALVGAGGRVRESTHSFRARYPGSLLPAELTAIVERVLRGQADRAMSHLDGREARLDAVVDSRRSRHALLTLLPETAAPASLGAALLDVPIDESRAILYLKDLDGRYLRVNRRYREFLGVEQERLHGRTDADLGPAETIDGPRLREEQSDAPEPLQLEYIVHGFQARPPLAVLRFPVRDHSGEPVAVCGVAAPLAEAHVARSECARLIRIERWSRLDPETVLAEVLEEWGVALVGPGSTVPIEDERSHTLTAELSLSRERIDQLERALVELQVRLERLERAQAATGG